MYDINYFIKKYKAIPAHMFRKQMSVKPGGPNCYLGHCKSLEEQIALMNIFDNLGISLAELIYGMIKDYQQPDFKKRILAALSDARVAKKAVEKVQAIANFDPLDILKKEVEVMQRERELSFISNVI